MAVSSVQLDLMEFVERNILPRYNQFDRAHNMAHVMRWCWPRRLEPMLTWLMWLLPITI